VFYLPFSPPPNEDEWKFKNRPWSNTTMGGELWKSKTRLTHVLKGVIK